jgi:hypothetical protein
MGIIDSVKVAKDVVLQVRDAEIKSQILSRLIDVQTACLDLQEKYDIAKRNVDELQK